MVIFDNCYQKKTVFLRLNLYRNSKHIWYSINTLQNSFMR